ncbi:MAG: hypothetical protein LLG06_11650 [Desulfobacteraceae bacterium]|nr:hypothetical protein [Desulfobacteraceae bacterium]
MDEKKRAEIFRDMRDGYEKMTVADLLDAVMEIGHGRSIGILLSPGPKEDATMAVFAVRGADTIGMIQKCLGHMVAEDTPVDDLSGQSATSGPYGPH